MGDERDEAWFEALFRAHANHIAAYARRRVPTDVDDVVSEVFAVAWRHRDKLPDPALPWLYRTASNIVLHSRRGGARRAALNRRLLSRDEPDRDPPDTWGGVVDRLDDVRRVERLFAVLPPRDVEILRLWAWERLPTEEIAYVLSISPVAARVRLHRARQRAGGVLATDAADDERAAPDATPGRRPAEEFS